MGLQRAFSTNISDMIKNVATSYLYQNTNTSGHSGHRVRNRNSGGTPKKGDEWKRMPLNVVMKIVSIHEHALEL